MGEEKERNYSKEYEKEKKAVKRYTVKIQKDIAKLLDDRLKQNGDTFTGLVKNAIEKYLKKN